MPKIVKVKPGHDFYPKGTEAVVLAEYLVSKNFKKVKVYLIKPKIPVPNLDRKLPQCRFVDEQHISLLSEGMTFSEYSDTAEKTRMYPEKYKILYPSLKLSGEAGEVAEKVGKQLRDKNGDFDDPEFKLSIKKELGDVLWYINAVARDIGSSLEEIALMNNEKLLSRLERNKLGGSGDDR